MSGLEWAIVIICPAAFVLATINLLRNRKQAKIERERLKKEDELIKQRRA